MEPEQREQFRRLLLSQREALLTTGAASKHAAKPVELDQTSVGRVSRVDAMQSQAMAVEAMRRNERQLARIDAALVRLERGEYGLCLACEEEIDPRRLAFDPAASLCVGCASKAERR